MSQTCGVYCSTPSLAAEESGRGRGRGGRGGADAPLALLLPSGEKAVGAPGVRGGTSGRGWGKQGALRGGAQGGAKKRGGHQVVCFGELSGGGRLNGTSAVEGPCVNSARGVVRCMGLGV